MYVMRVAPDSGAHSDSTCAQSFFWELCCCHLCPGGRIPLWTDQFLAFSRCNIQEIL